MNKPNYIVLHTAASGDVARGTDFDVSAAVIDQWHRERDPPLAGIGYHMVIRKSGQLEDGRPTNRAGAHTLGLNRVSLGLCFSGHGDIAPWTTAQWNVGLVLIRRWMHAYRIPLPNVIGHREVNRLIEQGVVHARFRTDKTCPGLLVDMDHVRARLAYAPVPQDIESGNPMS